MERIGFSGGLSVDLERIKCIKHIGNKLIIEYKKSLVTGVNPFTDEKELHEVNDSVEMDYINYETALDYKKEFDAMWKDYLRQK